MAKRTHRWSAVPLGVLVALLCTACLAGGDAGTDGDPAGGGEAAATVATRLP